MKLSKTMIMHYYMMSTSSYRQLLDDEEKCRRDRRIPRCALRTFKYSSFKYLFVRRNNQALLNATGHDHRIFGILLGKFKVMFDSHYECQKTKIIKPRDPNRARGNRAKLKLYVFWHWFLFGAVPKEVVPAL